MEILSFLDIQHLTNFNIAVVVFVVKVNKVKVVNTSNKNVIGPVGWQ